MFFPIKRLVFEKIKAEYMMKKMEQMKEIDELEKRFRYYAQFFEPQIELQMSNDNYVVALTTVCSPRPTAEPSGLPSPSSLSARPR